jgi:hypothetical protein
MRRLGDLSHALRWNQAAGAVIALMTDAVSNDPLGVHRTFLEPDGRKREPKMIGPQGVIRLTPDEDVTHGLGICEGVEDALAVLLLGVAPMWAATSCGAIERLPLLDGIESLTIFADADAHGMEAARACRDRWLDAEREAFIYSPKGITQ